LVSFFCGDYPKNTVPIFNAYSKTINVYVLMCIRKLETLFSSLFMVSICHEFNFTRVRSKIFVTGKPSSLLPFCSTSFKEYCLNFTSYFLKQLKMRKSAKNLHPQKHGYKNFRTNENRLLASIRVEKWAEIQPVR